MYIHIESRVIHIEARVEARNTILLQDASLLIALVLLTREAKGRSLGEEVLHNAKAKSDS